MWLWRYTNTIVITDEDVGRMVMFINCKPTYYKGYDNSPLYGMHYFLKNEPSSNNYFQSAIHYDNNFILHISSLTNKYSGSPDVPIGRVKEGVSTFCVKNPDFIGDMEVFPLEGLKLHLQTSISKCRVRSGSIGNGPIYYKYSRIFTVTDASGHENTISNDREVGFSTTSVCQKKYGEIISQANESNRKQLLESPYF